MGIEGLATIAAFNKLIYQIFEKALDHPAQRFGKEWARIGQPPEDRGRTEPTGDR
jgi:hypothetical protein